MKRALSVILGLSLVCSLASLAFADTEGQQTIHVFATVSPNISMGDGIDTGSGDLGETVYPVADLGNIQTGDLVGNLVFRVDANQEQLGLYAAATPLFKGDDPTNTEVLPIPLNIDRGIRIAPVNANPMGGYTRIAEYVGETTIDEFPASSTSVIPFESSQNNRFSQDVLVTVTWTQDDPEKPVGEYSGLVRLTAVTLMDDLTPADY